MLEIQSTKDTSNHFLKVLVYGQAGAGKTRLCATANSKPLIISAESGLLSLREFDLDAVVVKSIKDVREAFILAREGEHEWVCLDSISEIAEVCLTDEKSKVNDMRQAYGATQETMISLIKAFRNLNKNVYMSAKVAKVKDDMTGALQYGVSCPGQKLGAELPYLFDEVFCLHVGKDDEGVTRRLFQTEANEQYTAKDRSGSLDFWEQASLQHIHNKIMNKGE